MIHPELSTKGADTMSAATASATPVATTEDSSSRDGFNVTHIGYDSDYGWIIELARPDQPTDSELRPSAADLPEDIRAYLIDWLRGERS